MVWLTGGALAICLAMILGLLVLVVTRGGATFWPQALRQIKTHDGRTLLGELTTTETYYPSKDVFASIPDRDLRAKAQAMVKAHKGRSERRLIRTGNRSPSNRDGFHWVQDFEVASETRPEWAITVERIEWGRAYGVPVAFRIGDDEKASTPDKAWELYENHHDDAVDTWAEAQRIEKDEIGDLDAELEAARLRLTGVKNRHGEGSPEYTRALERFQEVEKRIAPSREKLVQRADALHAKSARYTLVLRIADGSELPLRLVDIVRAYPANRIGWFGKVGVYFVRWWEFISGQPREANSEGGVWPAIFGTIVLTMIMTLLVVPFGVLGALYLREYAKQGTLVSLVRIAVNNLAGVPSIVFGVFGLGFFCYVIGGGIDHLFFSEKLPIPTYGKGGILWASLTLALLTLPVVIVATEEALAAVPNSMREGSYACGASKWQTIRRIVLPRAMPGVMTGMILAIARGAGEVAPIMLVGAAKLAPSLPVDGEFPFVHPDRSFMHLGFDIYDKGFQSSDAKALQPMVFTTTLVLIAIVVLLNLVAIKIRSRLRRRYLEGA